MFDDILAIVLRALYWVLVPAALLRFQMQAVRAPFHNPIGQFFCAVTDWAVKPLRRVLPGRGGYDWASLAAAFLFELLHGLAFDILSMRFSIFRGAAVPWLASSVFGLAGAILMVAIGCIFIYVVISWVQADSPIGDILGALVNPWLRPIRRRMPMIGGFDLSTLVLLVLLQIGSVILGHLQSATMQVLARL